MSKMLAMLRAMDAFTEHTGGADELAADNDAVTCPTCGAAVEDDALDAQTMADGSLMWPRPFCRAHLISGLERLRATLNEPETLELSPAGKLALAAIRARRERDARSAAGEDGDA